MLDIREKGAFFNKIPYFFSKPELIKTPKIPIFILKEGAFLFIQL